MSIKHTQRLLLLALCLLCLLPAEAQYKRHELRLGFGVGNDDHYNNVRDDLADRYKMFSVEDFGDYNWSVWGEYLYHLNPHFAFGGTLGYSYLDGSTYVNDVEPGENYKNFYINTHQFFLMPSVKYAWLNRTSVSLYSRAAAGLSFYHLETVANGVEPRNEDSVRGAYQVSPFGVEVGGEHIRGFFELGYGAEGVFQMGIKWQLGKL